MTSYGYRLPSKYRYRKGSRLTAKQGLAIAGVIVLVAGVSSSKTVTGTVSHARGSVVASMASGGTDLNTRAGWAAALLAADSFRDTTCNQNAVTEWEIREGGGFGNQAAYDPLNVNPGPGAGWPGYSAIGAWAFPGSATGLRYTVATLNDADYDGIRAALRAGDSAQAVCNAIMASPWASSHYDGTLDATC